ncbi:MAG: hypothetical protein IJ725_05170, partial [Ruminococcus sp.]|nr:hypothetical protein [Ruminococcus sp.]
MDKAEKVAKSHNTTLDDLAKWYPRGEEDDEAQFENKKVADEAKLEPLWRSYQSVIEKPLRDLGSAYEYAKAGFTDDQYINPDALPSARTEAIRQGVTEDWDSEIAKQIYNIGMSTADSGWNMLLGSFAGNVAGATGATTGVADKIQNAVTLTPAFTGAATDKANSVIESGGDYSHAIASGVAAGAAEVITEKVSLDQLRAFEAKGVNSLRTALTNVTKGMFVEGSEEVAADLANTMTDSLINGGMSEVEQNKRRYIEQGYSEKEAESQAFTDWFGELGMSFIGGAAGGALFGAGTNAFATAANAYDTYQSGRAAKESGNVADLVEIGESYRKGTDAAKAASRVSQNLEENIQPSNMSVGRLQKSIISDSYGRKDGQNQKEIKARVQSYINNQNYSEDESRIANKLINGRSLSASEQEVVDSSDNLKNLVVEVDRVSDDLSENVARAMMSGVGEKLTKQSTRDIKNLKLNKDGMNLRDKYAALNSYADEHSLSPAEKSALFNNYNGSTNIDSYATNFLAYNNLGRLAAPETNIPKEYLSAYE